MLALVVLGRGCLLVGHVVFEHAVDEQGELTRGRRHGGGLVRASGQPAVEGPERVVATNEGHGGGRRILAARFADGCVRNPSSFPPPPPEILLFGASVSQEAKWCSVGQQCISTPISEISLSAP